MEDDVVEDELEDGEVVGEDGGVKVGGGEEGGGSLKILKFVFITSFWTSVSTSSLFSNKGFEYTKKNSSDWVEVEGNV